MGRPGPQPSVNLGCWTPDGAPTARPRPRTCRGPRRRAASMRSAGPCWRTQRGASPASAAP